MKNTENNGTLEIGLVTPTPERLMTRATCCRLNGLFRLAVSKSSKLSAVLGEYQ